MRRLWLAVHARELGAPVDAGRQGLFEQGVEVGRAAHGLFPGGVLVDLPASEHEHAMERTRALLEDPEVPAIFEAAFEYAGLRIRVDVLERLEGVSNGGASDEGASDENDSDESDSDESDSDESASDEDTSDESTSDEGAFGLREVKQSTSAKDDYLDDVAVQRWVLEGAGLDVRSVQLIHLNKQFTLREGGGRLDSPGELERLFVRADLDARLDAAPIHGAAQIAQLVEEQHAALSAREAPVEAPSRSRCRGGGGECPFWRHCTDGLPASFFIEGMRAKEDRKAHYRRAAESGRRWVASSLGHSLSATAPPLWYLDFEALGPALPIFPGTHPHQQIVFQYSLHHLAEDGDESHHEFLASGEADPRPATAAALVAVLAHDEAPIAVYSSYESRMLKDMAECSPELADALDAIRMRLVDLLPIVRKQVYDPGFEGSFSIKTVGPALAANVRYDDLEGIASGTAAARAFARIATSELRGEEAERVREALLAYCERDTLALMRVHQALLAMV